MYVRPRLEEFATFDFENVEYFLEEGYRAMREVLASWHLLGFTTTRTAAIRPSTSASVRRLVD